MKQLYTKWGENLNKNRVLQEYPRPQMVRESYINLNGVWQCAFTEEDVQPETWELDIVVPFSPEAALSGIGRQLKPNEYLWYRKTFELTGRPGMRTLLHFGAVDQTCEIWLNSQKVGMHHGGYLSFTVDITDYLQTENELILRVRDLSDTSYHAKGKQKLNAGGMFYTAQSGIWQTVWMEQVPENYIKNVRIRPDLDGESVLMQIQTVEHETVTITIYEPGLQHQNLDEFTEIKPLTSVEKKSNEVIRIPLSSIKEWSPEMPFLYDCEIHVGEDVVRCYFAMRLFTVEKDEKQIPRLCLNHQVYFQKGVLDQGYWPDGLYTAPSDEALVFDIQEMKKLGFNMLRKHIKIESERWYYHCDRLGMIVWQDMVNGGGDYHHWYVTYFATLLDRLCIRGKDTRLRLMGRENEEGHVEFEKEMEQTIRQLYSHPCIATWGIFNEGWGQFSTKKMTECLLREDESRFVDAASGWFDQGTGSIHSLHNYFFPFKMKVEAERATALSEFGGYSLAVKEHHSNERIYGYGICKNAEQLRKKYEKKWNKLKPFIEKGLCATIYTQVSDVEEEINGILTYDRKVNKFTKKN